MYWCHGQSWREEIYPMIYCLARKLKTQFCQQKNAAAHHIHRIFTTQKVI